MSIENKKNEPRRPIIEYFTINNRTNTRSIPGTGPIYFSMFVNRTRVKWFLGDVSAQINQSYLPPHNINLKALSLSFNLPDFNIVKHHHNHTTSLDIQYEQQMRVNVEINKNNIVTLRSVRTCVFHVCIYGFYNCYMSYGYKNVLYLMCYVILKSIFRPEKSPCEVVIL
jgi:hypothetical protein